MILADRKAQALLLFLKLSGVGKRQNELVSISSAYYPCMLLCTTYHVAEVIDGYVY